MPLQMMKYFAAVANGFTEAAGCAIFPSHAISQRIRILEEELGGTASLQNQSLL